MKIKVNIDHYLMVETKETYQSVRLFKQGEKLPIAGSDFGLSYTRKDLKKWGQGIIDLSVESMKQAVGEILSNFNEYDVVDALTTHGDTHLLEALKDHLKCCGYILIEPKTIRETDAIVEAINTVYPYHNEQQKIYTLNLI